MIKIKVHFSLTGRTDQWKKYINKDAAFSNVDNLGYVTDIIKLQFGNRPIHFINENVLKNEAVRYPEFFSAKWFVGIEGDITELVVVGHGNSMESAGKSASDSMKTINWAGLSKSIK